MMEAVSHEDLDKLNAAVLVDVACSGIEEFQREGKKIFCRGSTIKSSENSIMQAEQEESVSAHEEELQAETVSLNFVDESESADGQSVANTDIVCEHSDFSNRQDLLDKFTPVTCNSDTPSTPELVISVREHDKLSNADMAPVFKIQDLDSQSNESSPEKKKPELKSLLQSLNLSTSQKQYSSPTNQPSSMHKVLQSTTSAQQLISEQQQWQRDKEVLVMRYAQSEQKNIELQSKMNKLELRAREWMKDRENVLGRMNTMRAERQKLNEQLENRAVEIVSLRREIERQKEIIAGQDSNIKWHQSKVKVEQESHKETKCKLDEAQYRVKLSKDELEKTRREAESFIRKQQEVELLNSLTKDMQLKENEQELMNLKQDLNDEREVHALTKNELDLLKTRQKDLTVELNTYKDKVGCLEAERRLQEDTLNLFKDTLQKQKIEIKELTDKIANLDSESTTAQQLSAELGRTVRHVEELEASNAELMAEFECCGQREGLHVQDKQRLSDEIVRLQSERLQLISQMSSLMSENERRTLELSTQLTSSTSLEKRLEEVLKQSADESAILNFRIEKQAQLVDELRLKCEEKEDEVKTIKRRHLASSKDLMRQLSHLQKRLELYEGSCDNTNSSLSSSSSSRITTTSPGAASNTSRSRVDAHPGSPSEGFEGDVGGDKGGASGGGIDWDALDKKALVAKILRLQASVARLNEKLEFMEEHNQRLLDELLALN